MASVVVFGDSQIKYIHQYLPSNYDVMPFPGKKLTSFDFFPWEDVSNYGNIVIHFGTNDNSSGVLHCNYERHLYEILKKIRQINSACNIFVSEIIPRTKGYKFDRLNERAKMFNVYIRSTVKKFSGVFFISNWESFTPTKYISEDGLHLSRMGVKVLADNIVKAIVKSGIPWSGFTKKAALESSNSSGQKKEVLVKKNVVAKPKKKVIIEEKRVSKKPKNIQKESIITKFNRFQYLQLFTEQSCNPNLACTGCTNVNLTCTNVRKVNGGSNGSLYPKNCNACGKLIKTKQIQYYHNSHCKQVSIKKTIKVNCNICQKVFNTRSSLSRHIKKCSLASNVEGKSQLTDNSREMICANCGLTFLRRGSLVRHLKNCFKPKTCRPRSRIICLEPFCKLRFHKYSEMWIHMSKSHGKKVERKFFSFSSIDEFKKWKDDFQLATYMFPANYSGVKKSVLGMKRYTYMICQFDKFREHHAVSGVGNKWSKGCTPYIPYPARMMIHLYNSGSVEVCLINEHTHDLEFANTRYHRYPGSAQQQIMKLMALDVPTRRVQNFFQNLAASEDKYEKKPVMTDFISNREIRHYRYRYSQKKSLHPNDLTSVKIWVQNNKSKVFLYKQYHANSAEIGFLNKEHQKDLFILGIQNPRMLERMKEGVHRIICVDATHGTNPYNFLLYNFIMPDHYGRLYPVAHIIVNYTDEKTLTTAFQNLKAKDKNLELYAVMTDDDPALYNSLKNAFYNLNYKHILCHWHIRRGWVKNLSKIKYNTGASVIKEEIMIVLDKLLYTRNKNEFLEIESIFLEKFSEDDSTKEFMDYYKTYYHKRAEKWSAAFRNFPHFNINTNMLVESFHRALKHDYLGGKHPRRLMVLLEALTDYENSLHMKLTKEGLLRKPLIESCTQDQSHISGMKILDNNVTNLVENLQWRVKSQTNNNNTFYIVLKKKDKCDIPDHCYETCWGKKCKNLCNHLYVCECPVDHNMCKHIHKVHSLNSIYQTSEDSVEQSVKVKLEINQETKLDSNVSVPNSKIISVSIQNELKDLTNLNDRDWGTNDQPLLHEVWKSLRHSKYIYNAISTEQKFNLTPNLKKESIPPNAIPSRQLRRYGNSRLKKLKKIQPYRVDYQTRTSVVQNLCNPGKSFTGPMSKEENYYRKILFSFGPNIQIQLLCLKSLDPFISNEEFLHIKKNVSQIFQRGWLYDSILDAFFFIKCANNPLLFFIPTMESQAIEARGFTEKSIKNYRFLKENIEFDYIFIPCNLTSNHWTLLVITTTSILAIDPMSSENPSLINYAKTWQKLFSDKMKKYLKIETPNHIYQQDSMSCGVLVCWYFHQLINDESLLGSVETNLFRKFIYDTIIQTCEVPT